MILSYIGQEVCCTTEALSGVKDKSRQMLLSNHLDRASLVSKGLIYRSHKLMDTSFLAWHSGQSRADKMAVNPARVVNGNARFGLSCPLAKLVSYSIKMNMSVLILTLHCRIADNLEVLIALLIQHGVRRSDCGNSMRVISFRVLWCPI